MATKKMIVRMEKKLKQQYQLTCLKKNTNMTEQTIKLIEQWTNKTNK